jgi:hypothetical protein
MARISYKQRIHMALWELVVEAQKLGISIEVHDPRMSDNHDMLGCYHSTANKIELWKEADEPLTAKLVATLAHELEHVRQFKEGRYVNFWLMTMGFLPNWTDSKIETAVENEADDYAKAYLVKHRLKVPEVFDRKRLERKEQENEAAT